MALKGTIYGSFSGTSTSNVRPALRWTASQSISGNYSAVTVALVIYRYNTSWQSYNQNGVSTSITIDGNKKTQRHTFDIRNVSSGGYDVVWSRTQNVNHNSDGSRKLTIKGDIYTNTSLGNGFVSGTIYLDRIPRASSVSTGNSITYGRQMEIKINRKYSGFKDDVYIERPSGSVKIATKTTEDRILYTVPIDWMSDVSNDTRYDYTIRVETYQGSTHIGTSKAKQIVYVTSDAIPSITSTSIEEANQDIGNHFGGYYIQSKSKLKLHMESQGHSGSTIKQNRFVCGKWGKTNKNSNSFTATTDTLPWSGNGRVRFFTTDSRDRTVSINKNITVLPYKQPQFKEFKVERCNYDGTPNPAGDYAKVNYEVVAYYLQGKNAPKSSYGGTKPEISLKYKSSSDTNATTVQLSFGSPYDTGDGGLESKVKSENNNLILSNINKLYTYTFTLVVSDYFTTQEIKRSIGTGRITVSLLAGGGGLTIGQNATEPGVNINLSPFKYNGKDVLTGDESNLPSSAKRIPSGANLHDYDQPGYYYIQYDKEARNILNYPPLETAGALIVVNTGAGTVQLFVPYRNDKHPIFTNTYYSGSWYGWRRMGGVIDKQNGYFRIIGGLQITWSEHQIYKGKNNWLTFPHSFSGSPAVTLTPQSDVRVWYTVVSNGSVNVQTSGDTTVTMIAIGGY